MAFFLSDVISREARNWAAAEKQSARSLAGDVLRCLEAAGRLRVPQIRAIEVYLWLKFRGENRTLAEMVGGGALAGVGPYSPARQFFMDFALDNHLPRLTRKVMGADEEELAAGLRLLLRDFPYPNYLFSLPMGAGKTWLMAAFVCLDLHFSRLLPGDARFARNFVVFAPHAAKTAILPSLKTIRDFRPEWLLPAGAAAAVRRELRVEILDSPRAARRDTRVNNPNLEKVNRLAHGAPRGLVFITNAEKVVLTRPRPDEEVLARLGGRAREELAQTNELRERMAEIPGLTVILDEVHHAYAADNARETREKKLREAVAVLAKGGNLTAALGFSGTPYVNTARDILGEPVRTKRLPDVVYDFPLARGIGEFLKKPQVVAREGAGAPAFIREALDEFFSGYDRVYRGGAKSKIAFYCPSVRALNEDVLPVVKQWFAERRPGREGEIFSFYTSPGAGEKKFALPDPAAARAEFHNLDGPASARRVILLVAVGKEGWDCRSLTAVALPRRAAARGPHNFVLQTSCRCLREADHAADEAALIFLGDGNYDILNEELQKTHGIGVAEFQDGARESAPVIVRKPRLGALRFRQVARRLLVTSRTPSRPSPAARLREFSLERAQRARAYAAVVRRGEISRRGGLRDQSIAAAEAGAGPFLFPVESFPDFLMELSRALWGAKSAAELAREFGAGLRPLHAAFVRRRAWFANHPDGGAAACRDIIRELAACFAQGEEWRSEEIQTAAEIQLLEWAGGRGDIPWSGGNFIPAIHRAELRGLRRHPERLTQDFEDANPDPNNLSFNYIPYRLDSGFEHAALREMLREPALRDLELYYNGMTAGGLASFQIQTPAGIYTPDFLLLKRRGGRPYRGRPGEAPAPIERVLIIETKAAPFYDDDFRAREHFVKSAFAAANPNFRYVLLLDRSGRGAFGAGHLAELREQVNRWAAKKIPHPHPTPPAPEKTS